MQMVGLVDVNAMEIGNKIEGVVAATTIVEVVVAVAVVSAVLALGLIDEAVAGRMQVGITLKCWTDKVLS